MSDDLGPLPEPQAYRLTGPASFTMENLVWVTIQDTKDSLGWRGGLALRFLEWANQNRVYTVVGGISGGGVHKAAYTATDAARIRLWLEREGALETVRAP